MKNISFSLLLLFIFSSGAWAQEFVYVTDSLQLRVYAEPSTDSQFLQSIDSGDSVEVYETQDGFSKVATYDGTVGWVKSAFLVEDPPAKLLYYSVGEKNKQLEAEIEALKNNTQIVQVENNPEISAADVNQISELQKTLGEQQKINQELQQQLENNRADTGENIQARTDTYLVVGKNQAIQIMSNYKWWLVGVMAAFLIAGLWIGMKLSSWRMTKRFHGFRF